MTAATQRTLFLSLAQSEAWNDIVMPLFRAKLAEIDHALLTDPLLTGKALDDTRAKRFVLTEVFTTLRVQAFAAFKDTAMDVADKLVTPRSALETTILPAITLQGVGTSSSPAASASQHPAASIQFPPTHTFNPFASQPPPQENKPEEPPTTAPQ